MAIKVSIADGNWSTAGTWGSLSNTPTLHASSNLTVSSSSYYTQAFTAPDLVSQCLGMVFFLSGSGASASGTINIQLQENSAGWVDVVGVNVSVPVDTTNRTIATWVFAKFASGFTYLSTTSGYYRFKITRTGTFTSSPSIGFDSGGANAAFMAVDNRTGAPASSDNVFIVGYNRATQITVTVDGSQTIGSSPTGLITPTFRSITNAFTVGAEGVLTWDTTADASLTCNGNYYTCSYGSLVIGTEASPHPAAYKAKIIVTESANCNYGGAVGSYPTLFSMFGAAKSSTTLWRTTLSSGTGTAADPAIMADAVDWSVGDEIAICANSDNATNYNETEKRFIITKNSSTSYVWSSTLGGAEAALTYTHTDAEVLNIERNVIIESSTSSYGTFFNNDCITDNIVTFEWMRFNYSAHNTSALLAYSFGLYRMSGSYCRANYCVNYGAKTYGFYFLNSKSTQTHTGLICYGTTATNSGYYWSSNYNKTLNDCYAVHLYGSGFSPTLFTTMNRCKAIGGQISSGSYGGFVAGGLGAIMNDCEAHCCRNAITTTSPNAYIANNCLFGTKGKNTQDFYAQSDYAPSMVFNNCTFGSDILVSNYLLGGDGLEIKIHKYNGTTNKHLWYTNYGIAQSTGTGLSDTTVRTASSLALRLAPEEATTGFTWTFKILAKANTAISISGFVKKNAAFSTDDIVCELWLPSSTVADATMTMPDDENWNVFSLAANYTGTVDSFATVKIIAKSATSGAYCYIDDLYNGTNHLTALDVWYEGKPSDVMYEQLGDAAAVWGVSLTGNNTDGTFGWLVQKLLTVGKFIGLK